MSEALPLLINDRPPPTNLNPYVLHTSLSRTSILSHEFERVSLFFSVRVNATSTLLPRLTLFPWSSLRYTPPFFWGGKQPLRRGPFPFPSAERRGPFWPGFSTVPSFFFSFAGFRPLPSTDIRTFSLIDELSAIAENYSSSRDVDLLRNPS